MRILLVMIVAMFYLGEVFGQDRLQSQGSEIISWRVPLKSRESKFSFMHSRYWRESPVDSLAVIWDISEQAQTLFKKGDTTAFVLLKQSLNISIRRQLDVESARISGLLGVYYLENSDYSQSLKYLFQSLRICQFMNSRDTWEALQRIGQFYYKIRNIEKAIEYFNKSIELVPPDMNREKGFLMLNVAECYIENNELKIASEYCEKANRLQGHLSQLEISSDFVLGKLFLKSKQFYNAKEKLTTSIMLAKESNFNRLQAEATVKLAQVYEATMEYDSAILLLNESIVLLQDRHHRDLLLEVYYSLIKFYSNRGELFNLIRSQERYLSLKKEMLNQFFLRDMAKVQSSMLESEHLKIIEEQKVALKVQESILKNQKKLFIGVLMIVLVLIVLIFFLFKDFQERKRVYRILRRKMKSRIQEEEEKNVRFLNAEMESLRQLYDLRFSLSIALQSLMKLSLDNRYYHDAIYKMKKQIIFSLRKIDEFGLRKRNAIFNSNNKGVNMKQTVDSIQRDLKKSSMIILVLFLTINISLGFGKDKNFADTVKIDYYRQESGKNLEIGNYSVVKSYVDSALDLVDPHDSVRYIMLNMSKARVLWYMENFDESFKISFQMINYIKTTRMQRYLFYFYGQIGRNYMYLALYDQALKYLLKSLELREKYGTKEQIYVEVYNIGLLYSTLRDFETALVYFNKFIQIKKKIIDTSDFEIAYPTISQVHSDLGDTIKAKLYLNLADSICRQRDCNHSVMVNHLYAKGLYYSKLKLWSIAEKFYNQSFAMAKASSNFRFQAQNYIALAGVYIEQGRFSKAKVALLKAIEIGDKFKYNKILLDSYYQNVELCSKVNDFNGKSFWLKKFIIRSDEVYNANSVHALMSLQAEHSERVNSNVISENYLLSILREKEIKNQTSVNIVFVLLVILFIILLVVLLRLNLIRKNLNSRLNGYVKLRTNNLEINKIINVDSLDHDVLFEYIRKGLSTNIKTIRGLNYIYSLEEDHNKFTTTSIGKLIDELERIFSDSSSFKGQKVLFTTRDLDNIVRKSLHPK